MLKLAKLFISESSTSSGEQMHFLIKLAIFFNLFFSIYIYRGIIDIYVGYFIYLVLFPFFVIRYGFPKVLSLVFFLLLLIGVYYSYIGLNQYNLFFKVYLGAFTSYLFFYYIVVRLGYSVKILFRTYLELGLFAALFGILQLAAYFIGIQNGTGLPWLFGLIQSTSGGTFGIRIGSFMGEPTHLAIFLSAAYFVAIHDLIFWRRPYFFSKLGALTLIFGIYISFSGTLLISTFLAFIAIGYYYGISRMILIFIPLSIVIITQLASSSQEFEGRLLGTRNIFIDAPNEEIDVLSYHGSSVILYNNFHIAVNNFYRNPLFGTGLGSHPIAYDKYTLTKNAIAGGFDLNKKDANSMFNRLLSETGIFGLALFLIIIVKNFPRVKDEHGYWLISVGCLIVILINLGRQGHYFLNGFPFYLWLYMLTHQKLKLLPK